LDLKSLEIRRSGFNFKSNLTSAIGDFSNPNVYQDIFPTTIPWPMTLAPTNDAARCKNHAEKTFKGKKINHHNPGGHERCKDSITIKKA
jgi:hypothetical protein